MKLQLQVPLHLQGTKTGYCVPYALYGVAQYFGIPYSRREIVELVKADKQHGTNLIDAQEGMETIDIHFKRIGFDFKSIRAALRRGNPVGISFKDGPDSEHFSLITGAYKNARGIPFVDLTDTYYGPISMPLEPLWVLANTDPRLPHLAYELVYSP